MILVRKVDKLANYYRFVKALVLGTVEINDLIALLVELEKRYMDKTNNYW